MTWDGVVPSLGAGDMFKQSCAVVVIASDAAKRLTEVLSVIKQRMNGHLTNLVLVDNGSTDGTADVAAKLTKHVIRSGSPGRPEKHDAAILTALQFLGRQPDSSQLDCVICLAADGRHNPAMIGHLVALIEEGTDIGVFIQCRQNPECSGNFVATLADLTSEVTGFWVTEPNSDYFAIRWSLVAPTVARQTFGYGGALLGLLLLSSERAVEACAPLRYIELPHNTGSTTSDAERIFKRDPAAGQVFLSTCTELGIGRLADQQSAAVDRSWLEQAATVDGSTNGVNAK